MFPQAQAQPPAQPADSEQAPTAGQAPQTPAVELAQWHSKVQRAAQKDPLRQPFAWLPARHSRCPLAHALVASGLPLVQALLLPALALLAAAPLAAQVVKPLVEGAAGAQAPAAPSAAWMQLPQQKRMQTIHLQAEMRPRPRGRPG